MNLRNTEGGGRIIYGLFDYLNTIIIENNCKISPFFLQLRNSQVKIIYRKGHIRLETRQTGGNNLFCFGCWTLIRTEKELNYRTAAPIFLSKQRVSEMLNSCNLFHVDQTHTAIDIFGLLTSFFFMCVCAMNAFVCNSISIFKFNAFTFHPNQSIVQNLTHAPQKIPT